MFSLYELILHKYHYSGKQPYISIDFLAASKLLMEFLNFFLLIFFRPPTCRLII